MLNGYAAETNGRVKDRMRIIIKIKCDGMRIARLSDLLGNPIQRIQVARKIQTDKL